MRTAKTRVVPRDAIDAHGQQAHTLEGVAEMAYTASVMRGSQLGTRFPLELVARLDRIAAAVPGLTRGAVARVALERGLEVLETDPRYRPPPAPKRKPRTRQGG